MRPRVLHLAYEEPGAPGAGGGSVRTREINDRLAVDFDITVVSAAFPGCRPRTENGVRYRQLGVAFGHPFVSQLSYFALLRRYARTHGGDHDLVVEDFGAPFGSVGIPAVTSTPTVGVVQWLFAREKSRQYHLPFTPIEDRGLASHSRLITVSQGMAEQITARNPAARVDVVLNGLPDEARHPVGGSTRSDLLYLGRLDVEHKGLDLLLDSFAAVAPRIPQNLHIAGDGPGRQWLVTQIDDRGLGDRVRLLGRVPEQDRFAVMAGYDAVLMPSRYESFGMVAAEAAAVSTPVVAFDIACLRDLVPAELLAPSFDVAAFAQRLADLATDEPRRRRIGHAAQALVAGLSWDTLARQQAAVYRDVICAATSDNRTAPATPGRVLS